MNGLLDRKLIASFVTVYDRVVRAPASLSRRVWILVALSFSAATLWDWSAAQLEARLRTILLAACLLVLAELAATVINVLRRWSS